MRENMNARHLADPEGAIHDGFLAAPPSGRSLPLATTDSAGIAFDASKHESSIETSLRVFHDIDDVIGFDRLFDHHADDDGPCHR